MQVVGKMGEDGARGQLDRAALTVVHQQREGDALEQFAGRLGSRARLGAAQAGEGMSLATCAQGLVVEPQGGPQDRDGLIQLGWYVSWTRSQ